MLSLLPVSRSRMSCSRIIIRRRYLSSNTAEAFIRPLQSDPEIACLFLNKPQTKNAISRRMLEELQECLYSAKFRDKSFEPASVHSFVRSTSANAFCACMSPMDVQQDYDVTKIGLPETRLGIIPGAGGTQRAVRLLGLAKAKDLIFTARMLTASEALKWGVADYLARDIAKGAPLALRAAKQAMSRAMDLPLESGLDFERASYEVLLGTKDRIEALEAFKQKRVPVFKGE
ncbi:ClpP/crotonase-like domain-containing protein [Pisolithus microcarpus]|nr:ClpP/crotonase-like domain-containing protein [Pisolithus microcarpus]